MENFYKHFSDYVEGYQHDLRYTHDNWDGQIHFYDQLTGLIYKGLIKDIIGYFRTKNLDFEIEQEYFLELSKKPDDYKDFVENLQINGKQLWEHQKSAVFDALRRGGALIQCPTSSGKTLIIYVVLQALLQTHQKALVVVPKRALREQTKDDWIDYGMDPSMIGTSKDKKYDRRIIIMTMDSTRNLPKEFFKQFDIVIVDEAHRSDTKTITNILENCVNCYYRLGFSGSFFKTKANLKILRGLMGDIYNVITTKELMDLNVVSKLKVKIMMVNHSDRSKKFCRQLNYDDEISFLETCEYRTDFIARFLASRKQNTLFLIKHIEHGKLIAEKVKEISDKQVFFLDGTDSVEKRKEVINIVENNDDCLICSTFGIFGEGVSVLNLQNIVFGIPMKSPTQVIQAIGRGLRKCLDESKNNVNCYDIIDDLRYKSKINYGYRHGLERVNLYTDSKFDLELKEFEL